MRINLISLYFLQRVAPVCKSFYSSRATSTKQFFVRMNPFRSMPRKIRGWKTALTASVNSARICCSILTMPFSFDWLTARPTFVIRRNCFDLTSLKKIYCWDQERILIDFKGSQVVNCTICCIGDLRTVEIRFYCTGFGFWLDAEDFLYEECVRTMNRYSFFYEKNVLYPHHKEWEWPNSNFFRILSMARIMSTTGIIGIRFGFWILLCIQYYGSRIKWFLFSTVWCPHTKQEPFNSASVIGPIPTHSGRSFFSKNGAKTSLAEF